MTSEMHNSYNQFYATVFCLLYMFRTNLVVHHQVKAKVLPLQATKALRVGRGIALPFLRPRH